MVRVRKKQRVEWHLHVLCGDQVKLLVILRDPTLRLRTAFYEHPHYGKRFGRDAEGFAKYVTEQLIAWSSCVARHSVGRSPPTALLEGLAVHLRLPAHAAE